jgi:hypothetical protein
MRRAALLCVVLLTVGPVAAKDDVTIRDIVVEGGVTISDSSPTILWISTSSSTATAACGIRVCSRTWRSKWRITATGL